MIIDCHAHLETRVLSLANLIRKMDEQEIDKACLIGRINEDIEPQKSFWMLNIQQFLMNSDWLRYIAYMASLTFYNKEGRLRSIWKPFTEGGNYQKTNIPDNESVALAIQQYPDRFWGWIFVNPKVKDPVEEVERWGCVKGMIGIKAHPYWHRYPVQALEKILRIAEDRGLPLLIHLGFKSQGDFEWLGSCFPKLKIIFAHAAIPYFKKAWPFILEKKNLYVDISSPHLNRGFVHKVIQVLGAEKCLYGTDSPYGFLDKTRDYDYSVVKNWVETASISSGEKEKILGKNFLELIHV